MRMCGLLMEPTTAPRKLYLSVIIYSVPDAEPRERKTALHYGKLSACSHSCSMFT